MKAKFYVCKHCGNIIAFVEDKGVPVMCCGEKMEELKAGTVDAAVEKHVPVVTREGNLVKVSVGSVEHPMVEAHYIPFIWVETTKGNQMKSLKADEKPEAAFALTDGEEVVGVYAYCNLHGLWKAE